MFTVYVLYSVVYNKIYVGVTSDLSGRMLSHNELGTKGWTIRYRPWELLYKEEYATKSEALKIELELKSYQGRLFIRSLLKG